MTPVFNDMALFLFGLLQSKRDTLMVHIKWFYRPCEVPETVYQLLIQDRNALECKLKLIMDDCFYLVRQIFILFVTIVQVTVLIPKISHPGILKFVAENYSFRTQLIPILFLF